MPNSVSGIDLTITQRSVLETVFARYADRVGLVGVYGSRAQGRSHPGSDVDLVVFGKLEPGDLGSICSDLDESDLSIFADVIRYEAITHVPLKQQVDRWMKPLFTQDDLLTARSVQAA